MRLGWMGVGGLMLGLLAACSDEPDFDTRFEKASEEISERARALDAEDARVWAEMGVPVEPSADDGANKRDGKVPDQQADQQGDQQPDQPMSFRLPVPGSVARE